MVSKKPSCRKPAQLDQQSCAPAESKNESEIAASAAKIDTGDKKFDDLMKAEFKKRVFGPVDGH